MKRTPTGFAIAASILLISLAPHAASAAVINVNFLAATTALTTTTGPGYGLWAQGTKTWNVSGTTSATNLTDSDGAATSVDYALTVSSGSIGGNTNEGTGTGNFGPDGLTGQGKFSSNSATVTMTLTISDLVAGQSYDLLTYHARVNPNETETANGAIPVDFTGSTTTSGGAVYVDGFDLPTTDYGHFYYYSSVIADANKQIQVVGSGASFETFTGFQIANIPEPSAALLGGLGFLALLRRRR